MKLWARVFLGYFLIVGLSGWFLLRVFVSEVKPGVRDAVEDVMVDSANLLAELARDDLLANRLPAGRFSESVEAYRRRPVKATIWGLEKQTLDFRIYVTDAQGIVRYDSEHQAVGENYGDWRDVYRTLRGEYGSRSTRDDPDDSTSSVMHVAAPVHQTNDPGSAIVGVVTVAKPSRTLTPIIARGENAVLRQGLLLLGATLLIGGLFTAWLSVSLGRLVRYARALAAGQPAEPPAKGKDEIGTLARALAQLRDEVDGRAYVEHYVQHMTHEMKSPLAAIRGAAELLGVDDLPPAERQRFAANVQAQSERLQALIDKLLRLAQLEQLRQLESRAQFPLKALFDTIEEALAPLAEQRDVSLSFSAADASLTAHGDRFLLGLALGNLVQNALDFSPAGSTVEITATAGGGQIVLGVRDHGAGIPEYARARLFERFFSLPRPNGTPKSTGLGLPLVREIATLHDGKVSLDNAADGGAIATLTIAGQQTAA